MALLTVFTPTYNRAHTLPRLYASLCRQRVKDFEWLIVDDGSTDGTAALVARWQADADFPIHYHQQPNGGKMRAHNRGARLATTPLFVCIDSDDILTDDAVASIQQHHEATRHHTDLAGMVAYCAILQTEGNYHVRCRFPYFGASTLRGVYDEGFHGDTTLVFRTDVLRRFPFLEVEGEKFSTEAYAYEQMDRHYKFWLVDATWSDCEYMPDGYTAHEARLYAENPKGWALYFNQRVSFLPKNRRRARIAYAVQYILFARRAGMRHIARQSALQTHFFPLLWLLSYYYEWKWRHKYPR